MDDGLLCDAICEQPKHNSRPRATLSPRNLSLRLCPTHTYISRWIFLQLIRWMDLVVLVRSRVVRCRQWLAYPSAAVQRLKCSQRRYPCQPLGALPGISRNHAIASSGKVSGGEVSKRKQFKQVRDEGRCRM